MLSALSDESPFKLLDAPEVFFRPSLLMSFDKLKKDAYMKSGDDYRYRAFAQGTYKGGGVKWAENTEFTQPKSLNTYMGGVERRFDPVESSILGDLAELVSYLIGPDTSYPGELKIGCHQIRIKVSADMIGKPAPEGFHQDGFDYICLVCVNAINICGGLTLLRTATAVKKEIASVVLEARQGLFIDDRNLEHYTTPISHRIPGDGYRDVLVFTFKKVS